MNETDIPDALEMTRQVTRGVCRAMTQLGHTVVTEFALPNGRRADVAALVRDATLIIIEVKVTVADFNADSKWPEYGDFCDQLYFAVPAYFPREILPDECGIILADAYGGEELRPAPMARLHGNRRRALVLKFARTAAARLQRLNDPGPG